MRDLIIVIIAIIALWFLWFATGGPERESGGPFLKPFSSQNSEETVGAEEDKEERASSPGDTVLVTDSGNAHSSNPQKEYVVLEAPQSNNGSVRIDNWSLRNKEGASFQIGDAADTLFQGRVNREHSLYLDPGERAYVVTGNSPVGVSFQTNACSGYLEQFQTFSPTLSRSCPSASADALRSFKEHSRECRNFLSTLPQCEIFLEEIPGELPQQCVDFIENKVNYNSCVDVHRHDRKFRNPEWRVYLRQNEEIWDNTSDLIRLYNHRGQLVDSLSY